MSARSTGTSGSNCQTVKPASASQSMKRRWQLPARQQWFAEASRFAGVEPREPARKGDPLSLEKFIAAGMR